MTPTLDKPRRTPFEDFVTAFSCRIAAAVSVPFEELNAPFVPEYSLSREALAVIIADEGRRQENTSELTRNFLRKIYPEVPW
jgi:hypothetical protein